MKEIIKKQSLNIIKIITVLTIICTVFIGFGTQQKSSDVNAVNTRALNQYSYKVTTQAVDANGVTIPSNHNTGLSNYLLDTSWFTSPNLMLEVFPSFDNYYYQGYYYENNSGTIVAGSLTNVLKSEAPLIPLSRNIADFDNQNFNPDTDPECYPCISYKVYVVYALQYTVTYDANGGTGSVVDAEKYLDNTPATIKDGAGLTKDGFEFTSWNTAVDGSGITYTPADVLTMTENLTLYAQWVPMLTEEAKFTITYHANEKARTIVGVHEFAANTDAIIRDGAGLVKAGYEFTGWNTAADGTGVAYAPNSTVVMTQNLTLFATWKAVEVPVPVTVTPVAALPQTGNKTLIYVLELIVAITALAGIKLALSKKL